MVASEGLTVCAVLWVGDFRQRRYGPQWVVRLRNMVARHLPIPHRFVCLTNAEVPGVETLPLPDDLPGWWAKVALHKPGLLSGRCLYLDLDTIPVSDLSDIVTFPAPLAFMPPSFTFGGGAPAGGRGVIDRYQTSCMVWDAGEGDAIWTAFTPEVMHSLRGDQDWCGYVEPKRPTMPPGWFRKLRHCTSGPPDGVKVVLSMPWKNDEASGKFDWVRDAWR